MGYEIDWARDKPQDAEYKHGTLYYKGDRVKFNGKTYLCTPPILPRKMMYQIANGIYPTNTEFWTEITFNEQ